jgi:hypothetical protein
MKEITRQWLDASADELLVISKRIPAFRQKDL